MLIPFSQDGLSFLRSGVYCKSIPFMRSELTKCGSPKSFSPDPKMFFSGLVVTCAEVFLSLPEN